MLKIKLQSLVRPKVFWPSITILLILCVTLYILKEKEKSLRIYTENELTKTVEEKRVVENNLAEAKEEILTKEEQIKLTLDKLEKEMAARKEAEAQLIAMIEEKKVLETKIQELTAPPQDIELEKIVIKTASDVIGKVLAFDNDHGFVVIDLGSMNDLRIGEILSIYRDDQLIGKVQVEKIEEKTSAAAILPEWQDVEFQENDVVKRI